MLCLACLGGALGAAFVSHARVANAIRITAETHARQQDAVGDELRVAALLRQSSTYVRISWGLAIAGVALWAWCSRLLSVERSRLVAGMLQIPLALLIAIVVQAFVII